MARGRNATGKDGEQNAGQPAAGDQVERPGVDAAVDVSDGSFDGSGDEPDADELPAAGVSNVADVAAADAAAAQAHEAQQTELERAIAARRAKSPEPDPEATRTLVPMANGDAEASKEAEALLMEACNVFGIVPYREVKPVELLYWNYKAETRDYPARVTLVTAGGMKLRHYADPEFPMDPDTLERLHRVFGPTLPDDLALPIQHVTGIVTSTQHVYRRGYLREGGKAEADRRESKPASNRRR